MELKRDYDRAHRPCADRSNRNHAEFPAWQSKLNDTLARGKEKARENMETLMKETAGRSEIKDRKVRKLN